MNTDSFFFERTLALAVRGRGRTSPNPMVGAVLVKDGRIIAEGYHRRHGDLHAEAAAIEAAGSSAGGAELYCSLEPCSYRSPEKLQPPCTERIIAAGVRHVHIGQLDPNPKVSGRGVLALREAGIGVSLSEENEAFWRFNDAFNTRMVLSRPFVHLKCAMSLDGRIAAAGGDSRWISDESARRVGHRFRSERDAVAVGIGTVLADDPELSTRLVEGHSPCPVVFDSSLKIPLESRLVRERGNELIVLTRTPEAATEKFLLAKQQLEDQGVRVLYAEPDPAGKVDLSSALDLLYEQGIGSLLVEGGSGLLTSFLKHRLYDRLSAFVAPLLLGSGVEAVGDLGIIRAGDGLAFEGVNWFRIGDQQLFDAYRSGWLEGLRNNFTVQEAAYVHGTC
ncbi:bifunctional diaminohydroxyphosphoribosylaminopyrimidine deaminase/5-amino-6-(5-phosphoribosylamino)uracil reductase RibD [Marispirochaeta aestuarii]|uniref:bifunctional diaminohydroxyphosphoribosylaminopyrimidine deaminase/5-amino-6-(5-phosphoribosylamino)uracil reductase RibD n=1 Tax=Marispirochaeta aestuarii TaxID=1963862 RepID=UPI0029C6D76C|nr:bifunctional diaminohydroxyphosphoribosylaminopyrimidine deaminase/5-amino-6-(5-phosphoribosylamino)uracil reductase RibD [Marispirochaeta aestuarii]